MTTDIDDYELVRQAQLELPYRTAAFEALMRRHQSRLYGLCLRMLGHAEDAEDATQEVMLKVFHSLKTFSGRSAFSTWLYRIASNTCLDFVRGRGRFEHTGSMEEGELVAYNPTTDEKMLVAKLMEAIGKRDRLVVSLRHAVGLSFDEIAESTGMGLSAVKMRYYRAMDQMRRYMDQN